MENEKEVEVPTVEEMAEEQNPDTTEEVTQDDNVCLSCEG